MKVSKRQLRRIIKEEKHKLIGEAGPPYGGPPDAALHRSMYDGVWNHIKQLESRRMLDLTDRRVAESFAKALEDIVGELRDGVK